MKKLLSSSVTPDLFESIHFAKENNIGIEISRFTCAYESDEKFKKCLVDLKKELSDYKEPLSVHGFFFDVAIVSKDPEIKRISLKRYDQSLEIARQIGAKTVVFHTNFRAHLKHKKHQEKFYSSMIDFWQNYSKKFEDAQVCAVLENVNEPDSTLIKGILEEVNSDFLKASIDTGHVNAHSEKSVSQWIKSYSNNLKHMHIHNNYGDDDAHNSILKGTLDFNSIIKTLKDEKLEPFFIFEIFNKKDAIESVNYFEKLWNQN